MKTFLYYPTEYCIARHSLAFASNKNAL